MKKTLISLPALALGITMLANAQAATTPTKVGIIHIQNAILATKDGQKAANDLQTKFSPTKSQIDKMQNEVLLVLEDGERLATVPDIISVLGSDTGEPFPTEGMRLGQRVTILAHPSPAVWTTPEGLSVATEGAAAHKEKKIDLPDSWVMGFLQVHSTMTLGLQRFPAQRVHSGQ